MGYRLSAISTRTGDGGQTRLGDGSSADPRVGAMGEVDELNSPIGLLLALGLPPALQAGAQMELSSKTSPTWA